MAAAFPHKLTESAVLLDGLCRVQSVPVGAVRHTPQPTAARAVEARSSAGERIRDLR